jgi:hypothetical protein
VEINKIMITYTWEFPRFSTHPDLKGMKDVVYAVEFILSASDGQGHGSQFFGTVGITEPDPLTYIPFRLLTQPEVQQWVEDSLGDEQVTSYKDLLASKINEQANPQSVILDKPW